MSNVKTQVHDSFQKFTDKISEWYKPFNTVEYVNKYFGGKLQKLLLNGTFVFTSIAFLISGCWALYRNYAYDHPLRFSIKAYIASLVGMFIIDTLAVYFEGKEMIKEKKIPHVTDIISITLSFVVGIITLFVLIEQIKDHTLGKTTATLTPLLLIFKMVLAAFVAVNSGIILSRTIRSIV